MLVNFVSLMYFQQIIMTQNYVGKINVVYYIKKGSIFQMQPTLTTLTKVNIYISTCLVYGSFIMTIGIVSRIKDPLVKQFGFSQSFLGILDAISFLGSLFGFLAMTVYPVKRPVQQIFIVTLLYVVAMEGFYFATLVPSFAYPILVCCSIFSGFFKSFNIVPFFILNVYFSLKNNNHLLQMWYSLGILGEALGIFFPQLLINTFHLDWTLAVTLTLLILFLSGLYLFLSVPEIFQQNTGRQGGFQQTIQFLGSYWSNRINLLHTILYQHQVMYYVMLLWLPYFFAWIGYSGGAYIALAYTIGYVMSGIVSPPFYTLFKNYIGLFFLVGLFLNIFLAIILWQLRGDNEDIVLYIVLLFFCSIINSVYTVFLQTIDQKNRTQSHEQFMRVISINRSILQTIIVIMAFISGVIIEHNQYNLFGMLLVWNVIYFVLHTFRLAKYPQSFIMNNDEHEEEYHDERAADKPNSSKDSNEINCSKSYDI